MYTVTLTFGVKDRNMHLFTYCSFFLVIVFVNGMDQGDENVPEGRLPRRHNRYSVQSHILDCEHAIQHGTVHDVADYARCYRLSETSLRRWIANRETLMEQAYG
jgi:hypothetical protein